MGVASSSAGTSSSAVVKSSSEVASSPAVTSSRGLIATSELTDLVEEDDRRGEYSADDVVVARRSTSRLRSSSRTRGNHIKVQAPVKILSADPPALLNEIKDGAESLSLPDLAAWICRANNLIDDKMVQRARRNFKQRLSSKAKSSASFWSNTVPCPGDDVVSRASFEWFLKPANRQLRKPPRANVEYWESVPDSPWRDYVTKKPIDKKIILRKETEFREGLQIRDAPTANKPEHAEKLHGGGVSVAWLLAFTFELDLWNWQTWEVALYIVKNVTELRGRCRFTELPEVKKYVGPAGVYCCHCWCGRFGDLVAAVCCGARSDRFVFIDIFAVRQWPGSNADIDAIREVIGLCEAVIVVAPPFPFEAAAVCKNNHPLLPGTEPNRTCSECGKSTECFSCTRCEFALCSACFRSRKDDDDSLWFAKDEGRRTAFMDSESFTKAAEIVPFFRLWCLVEIQAAIELDKAVIFKVGSFSLKREGKGGSVTFEEAQPRDRWAFLMNSASMISLRDAEYSMPDDFARVNRNLGSDSAVALINQSIASVMFAAASERSRLETDCFLCGEFEAVEGLTVERLHAAFDAAASGGRSSVMYHLLASRPDDIGEHSFHLCKAAIKGNIEVIEILLTFGAPADVLMYGRTPLAHAVENGRTEIVRLLISRGAHVNRDAGGRGTALWIATSRGYVDIVELLIEAGADTTIASVGQTPLMVAEANGANLSQSAMEDLVRLLSD